MLHLTQAGKARLDIGGQFRRRLLPVAFGELGFERTVASLTKLMGKGEAAARRELMELHGDAVEVDV